MRDLFRQEATEHQRVKWAGKALLITGLPAWCFGILSFLFILIFLSFLLFSNYTRRVNVYGEIITFPRSVNVFAPQVFIKGNAAALQVRNLRYQYDRLAKPIITDLNLSIAAGESVAIVGPSGVGKTTLMKLMCGLLPPDEGAVLVDGMDISNIGVNNYRQCIACVLQDDKLLAGSIAENISGFDAEMDLKRIEACARRCNMHDDIQKMPMGYETLIGELGGSLSGGQKQRLLIARALYRRPSILFMDEATSHLDLKNEAHINNAIAQLNITRVIIAHRPSTIESVDRLIALV
ncbi:RTX-I toxin determinant B [Serratia proteamaculans]|nr:RTX-I toxin determinant B [Serratia proteamaculans]CAI0818050.1 RTX-I toxin determinant B [Serratia proteamaculans]CAI0819672.1 RTX-I toxin determinant B [Serratia proteamaculans]CAI2067986.1 RTX-I toxin determinant B [Serratia proteamaculans]CAI2423201.1 RTX-I toxin determinant B [Serratia proteamaculans]